MTRFYELSRFILGPGDARVAGAAGPSIPGRYVEQYLSDIDRNSLLHQLPKTIHEECRGSRRDFCKTIATSAGCKLFIYTV